MPSVSRGLQQESKEESSALGGKRKWQVICVVGNKGGVENEGEEESVTIYDIMSMT